MNEGPVWAPDGKHIAFASNRDGRWRTYWVRSDGLGEVLPLTGRDHPIYPSSFSPDGRWLAVTEVSLRTSADVSMVPLQNPASDKPGAGRTQPFLNAQYLEQSARFSPDGHWVAYVSSEQTNGEVYVRAFPDRGSK